MDLTIRMAKEEDADQVQAIYAPFCALDSPVSFEIGAPGLEEIRRRIARTLEFYPWLVCERSGEVLGYVYAGPHNERAAYLWSVTTAIYIGRGQRRSGVGRALYTSLFAVLRLQGFINAYAGIVLPNPASVGLHRAMGFEQVGIYQGVGYKCGTWLDAAWWQLSIQERATNPPPPSGLGLVRGTSACEEAVASGLSFLRQSSL